MENKKISQLDPYSGSPDSFDIPGVANGQTRKTNLGAAILLKITSQRLLSPSDLKTVNGVPLTGQGDIALELVHPFKGWYDSLEGLQTAVGSPAVGDYAYIKGATASDPAAIYECATAGTWSDSGRTVDTGNVQSFASGQPVSDIAIDGTGLANPLPNALAKAEDVKSGLEQRVGVIACKNLCGSKTEGYRMRSNGSLEESSNYNTYDYIPVTANTDYVISMNGTKPSRGHIVAFYDSSKTFISALYEANSPYTVVGDLCYKTFNTPENTAFIRFIERKTNSNVQLEAGTYPTYYIDPNQASTYADTLYQYMGKNKKEMVEKISVKRGKNLYTGLNELTGQYITSGGGVSSNSSYSVSDYIPVTAGHTYYVSANNNAAVSSSTSMYGAWYDETFSLISATSNSMYSKSFTAPENAVYFRFTHLNSRTNIMVEDVTEVENPTRTGYEPYSEISGYYPVLRDGQVTYGKLAGEVQELLGNTRFGSFISSGEIAAGVTNRISNTTQSVRKNILYSALFEGAIDSDGVVFGVGSTDSSYHGFILTITDTNIILHRLDSTGTGTPHAHGLTLTNRTTVSIETMLASTEELNTGASVDSPISKTIIKVSNDLGDSFTYEYGNSSWGYGQLFVGNNTANAVQYRIDFFPKDIEKPIWIFADSYGEFDYRNRFPYFLWKEGYTNHLLNAHGGADGTDALTDLNNLLSLGKKPSFIVWLMGQNGDSDTQVEGEWVIASTQRTNIDNFLALCDANDITPVLCTVPSVTAPRYHHGLCEYVRNSGRRYIDWEKAVGCNPDTGAWNTGLLSSDNVHPTGTGSYVLMRQMLVDFPEIAVL